MNTYGSGIGMAALFGLLFGILLFLVVLVLVVLSWKWSRPGASIFGLAFPVLMPLLAVVLVLARGGSPTHALHRIIWVGFWTVMACGIWGRAIWLRRDEDGSRLSVRSRQRDLVLSLVVVGLLYGVWTGLTLADAIRFRRWLEEHRVHEEDIRARQNAEWTTGRIVTNGGTLCYSRDGRRLAVVANSLDWGQLYLEIWDLTTGEMWHRFPLDRKKRYVQLHVDRSDTYLALQAGHEVEVYDLTQKQGPITLLAGPTIFLDDDIHICFLDGHDELVVLRQGKAHIFEATTGKSLPITLPALEQTGLAEFAVSSDNRWHATWSHLRQQIAVWQVGNSQPTWTVDGIDASRRLDLQFSSDGMWLAISTRDGTIVVWNAVTGKEQQRWTPPKSLASFRFSEDDRQILAVTSENHSLQVFHWDLATGQLAGEHTIPVVVIGNVALDVRGRELAATVHPGDHNAYRLDLKLTIQRFDTLKGTETRGFGAN